MVLVKTHPACTARIECSMPANMVCPLSFQLPCLLQAPGPTSCSPATPGGRAAPLTRLGRFPSVRVLQEGWQNGPSSACRGECIIAACLCSTPCITPIPATPPTHAALSNDSDPPVIQSLERGPTVATLRFRKPAAMSDQDDLVYRAQVGCALMSCVFSLPLALCRSPNSARCTPPLCEHVQQHCTARHSMPQLCLLPLAAAVQRICQPPHQAWRPRGAQHHQRRWHSWQPVCGHRWTLRPASAHHSCCASNGWRRQCVHCPVGSVYPRRGW